MSAISIDTLKVETREFTLELDDLQIEAGACVAIIGPNGAGKSTLIETLLGLRKTVRLKASLLGFDVARWAQKPELRQRLGVLLQRTQLPFGLRVRDVVKLHKGLYKSTSPAVIEALGISAIESKRYDQLSSGQMQRTELVMALAHTPDLLFLDEPLNALDQSFAAATCDLISRMGRTTVMMACHRPNELALADVALWMQDGKKLAAEHPDSLRQRLIGDFRLNVTFQHAANAEQFRTRLFQATKPRHFATTGEFQVSAFGDESLVRLAKDLIQDDDTASLEFGRTSLSDLLYRCAQVETNA